MHAHQEASSAIGNYTTLSVHIIAMNLGDVQFLQRKSVCVCGPITYRYQSQVHEVLFMDVQEKLIGIVGWHGYKRRVKDIRIFTSIHVPCQLLKPY